MCGIGTSSHDQIGALSIDRWRYSVYCYMYVLFVAEVFHPLPFALIRRLMMEDAKMASLQNDTKHVILTPVAWQDAKARRKADTLAADVRQRHRILILTARRDRDRQQRLRPTEVTACRGRSLVLHVSVRCEAQRFLGLI